MVVSTVDKYYAIMLDIDFFKKVNDTYGHQTGDLLLKSLADILKKYADGRSVILARFGGEEFVLLSKLSYSETEHMCRHIILDVRTNLKTIHGEPITVSMGISYKGYYDGFEGLLIKDADKNLYLAKKNGRNTVFYSEKRME
jgi:diguanylate cyclase (GGDEF)-like protein